MACNAWSLFAETVWQFVPCLLYCRLTTEAPPFATTKTFREPFNRDIGWFRAGQPSLGQVQSSVGGLYSFTQTFSERKRVKTNFDTGREPKPWLLSTRLRLPGRGRVGPPRPRGLRLPTTARQRTGCPSLSAPNSWAPRPSGSRRSWRRLPSTLLQTAG